MKASLRASEQAKRKLRVYAVEKNANAVVTLRNLKVPYHDGLVQSLSLPDKQPLGQRYCRGSGHASMERP